MTEPCHFQGTSGWRLENGDLSAVILPEHGGKVASLWFRRRDWELLFQNPKETFRKARPGDDFGDYEACGFDDAFPSVDAGAVDVDGQTVRYPDHGEIWTAAMTASPQPDGSLLLCWDSPLLGYRYEKRVWMEGPQLVCRYRITNPTDRAFPALWVCHCLVRAEPKMRILFPEEVKTVRNVYPNGQLGADQRLLSYPLAEGVGGTVDLRRMPDSGAEKFYAEGKVSEGRCRYEYPCSGMAAELRYDSDFLPYLGFWATAGAFRGDVNCALEPASGFYDSIAAAQKHHACPVLHPGECWTFSLSIALETI